MPSLKLSNPFRRGADRLSLKQRAASLKATAGRVMRRKAPEPAGLIADLHAMVGGVDHPDGTMSFCDASGRVLRKPVADWIGFTVQRLYSQARTEMARQLGDPALSGEDRAALAVKLRRDLRLDALGIAASRSREAFDVAMAAEDEATRAPIPAPNVFPSGPISGDLHTAVEAHREARQMMVHDPIEDDARTAAHVERITALGDTVREIPARTLADLRHKVIYLWPGALAGEVADDEVADTFRSFRNDVMGLVAQPFTSVSGDGLFPNASAVPANLDFSSLPLRTLEALHDHAVTLHSVAVGLQALPCSTHGERGWLNHAGLFAAWLGEVAGWMEQHCKEGARGRLPTTTDEQCMRLQVLASTIVKNGDTDDMKDFARELFTLAEA